MARKIKRTKLRDKKIGWVRAQPNIAPKVKFEAKLNKGGNRPGVAMVEPP